MRVTDLEDFSLTFIWRPYWQTWQAMHDQEWDGRSILVAPPLGLEETADELKTPSRWSDPIIDRLRRLDVTFPTYVQHPLVDVIRERILSADEAERLLVVAKEEGK